MPILVDTSVWIDHLRKGDDRLRNLLRTADVVSHPFIIGEIACGRLSNREEILDLLQAIPRVPPVTFEEALQFIDIHQLMGRGIGYVDVHLLASAHLERLSVWTRDRRLRAVAQEIGLSYRQSS